VQWLAQLASRTTILREVHNMRGSAPHLAAAVTPPAAEGTSFDFIVAEEYLTLRRKYTTE
jgi:hypothetical protein